MDKAVKHAMSIGAGFAEAKGEDTMTGQIEAVNKDIRKVSEIRNIGIGVRVFYGKGNGFSFSSVLDTVNVFHAVETAMEIAKASSKRTLMNLKLAEAKTLQEKRHTAVKKLPTEVSLDEKKDLCLRQCETATGVNRQIVNATSLFGEYHGTILYANSEGTKVCYEPLLIGLRITCVAKKGNIIADAWDTYGGSVGLTAFDEEAHTPERMAENAAKWAVEKLKAKPAPAGKFDAVIDPRLVGVLAHELAHVVVDLYFGVPPPQKIHELLAQFVETHLKD